MHRAKGMAAKSRPLTVWHIFFHPDYYRRPWNLTRSADPACCRRSRAITAGGELRPALKTYALL